MNNKNYSQYPDPDDIALPDPDDTSPDQEYYVGWMVQHSRLWLTTAGIGALCLFLVFALISQSRSHTAAMANFKPTVQYVTLKGGYPVVWREGKDPAIDGTQYVAARFRAVVNTFIENRYGLDYQNFAAQMNTALGLMSEEAREAEARKIAALSPRENILGVGLKVDLILNDGYEPEALGDGRFRVEVTGMARITDRVRNEDPVERPVRFSITVQTVPATEVNPLGYVVVATGNNDFI